MPFVGESPVPQCPVCDAAVSLQTTPTAPFCSDRCRLIDLGRWLEEGYSVPHVASDEEDDEGEFFDASDQG
jgi:endogenous inhibitor of DNA gyrase (YacG/DUF329 family)